MKKYLLVLLLLGVLITAFPERVYSVETCETKCESALLGCVNEQPRRCKDKTICARKYQDLAYYLQITLNIIKYVGVIACIAFSVIDFVKILISDDKDGYKKAIGKALKRLIYAAIIFFLPYIINAVLEALGVVANSTHCIS